MSINDVKYPKLPFTLGQALNKVLAEKSIYPVTLLKPTMSISFGLDGQSVNHSNEGTRPYLCPSAKHQEDNPRLRVYWKESYTIFLNHFYLHLVTLLAIFPTLINVPCSFNNLIATLTICRTKCSFSSLLSRFFL